MSERRWAPWIYDAENQWVTRALLKADGQEADDGFGEIWCEFKQPPDDDELEWLLEQLNKWESENE